MTYSLTFNPQAPRYESLREHLQVTYEDNYWPEDAIFMERNSRDFRRRIHVINENAESIAEYLRSQSVRSNAANTTTTTSTQAGTSTDPETSKSTTTTITTTTTATTITPMNVINEVFYPKWVTRENYDACKNAQGSAPYPSGYGGLLSISFTSPLASRVFFDSLACEKGPSLGKLRAIIYLLLAHALRFY